MKIIAFFNNKGGVGKTTLVCHLAHMFSRLGVNTLAVDLDPQANLTSAFLDEERLEAIWPESGVPQTIVGALHPRLEGSGDIDPAHLEKISDNLHLICGDLGLSGFEDELSQDWSGCADCKQPAFRTESAFYRITQEAAQRLKAGLVLFDVGPNLGAINRAALICANHLVVPLAADLYSLQGLRNLGPTVKRWRAEWTERRGKNPNPDLALPSGEMTPAGYVVMQHAVRLDRPVKAYAKWSARIPGAFHKYVLEENVESAMTVENDPCRLGSLRNYKSLMPYSQAAGKPMFDLKPADGAVGGQQEAVRQCRQHFEELALAIAKATQLSVPISNQGV
jgi:cellulose biosynthesis protein BcsQ